MKALPWIATAVPLLIGSLLLSVNITKPFIGQHDWNGVVYGQEAKNFVRYGYLPLRFGATLSAGIKPIEELKFSTHYAPVLPVLISFSYRLFGVSEWSTRLFPILASISSLFLIMLLGTELVSWRAGMIAGALAAVTPMFIYYGKNPVHEVVQLPFSLLAFYAYLKLRRTSMNTWLLLIIGSLTAAMLVGWPGYYAVGLIALHGLLFGKHRRLMLVLLTLPFVLFALYLLHVSLIAPESFPNLFTSASARIGSGVSMTSWIQREVRYAVNLFSGTLLGLSGIWMIQTTRNAIRGRINEDEILLAFLGVYGTAHAVLFRDASWFHEYLLFPFLPFLALTSAMVVDNVIMRLKIHVAKVFVMASVLIAVGFERAGYAKALLTSEYARSDYEEAIQFAREHEGKSVRIPEERDVYFVFYADQLD